MEDFYQKVRSAITSGGLEIAPYTVIRKEKVCDFHLLLRTLQFALYLSLHF